MGSDDLWDDDGWEDMPIVRSEPNVLGLDDEDEKKYHYKAPEKKEEGANVVTGNAVGVHIASTEGNTVPPELSWREKLDTTSAVEDSYTRLRLAEDEESEEVHLQTKFLFDEDQAMTPLSQMQATKNLLTEGQRIAYVGLCKLAVEEMIADLSKLVDSAMAKKRKGKTGEVNTAEAAKTEEGIAKESCEIWGLKIMARLYAHMELEREEQKMIESLVQHGVLTSDLVPSLITTHTVPNPEYDPVEARRLAAEAKEAEENRKAEAEEREIIRSKLIEIERKQREGTDDAPPGIFEDEDDLPPAPPPKYEANESSARPTSSSLPSAAIPIKVKVVNPFGDDDDGDLDPFGQAEMAPKIKPQQLFMSNSSPSTPSISIRNHNFLDEDGDIGALDDDETTTKEDLFQGLPTNGQPLDLEKLALEPPSPTQDNEQKAEDKDLEQDEEADVPSVLPGVSTTLTVADENVTLDIRWTILCDLFLALIADSVYDSRSRVLLELVASKLSLGVLDVVRFEKRVTDSLEIQEGVEKMEQGEVIEGRKKSGRKRRYVMMGLATLGGGLVIGLSAGLLAPVIGAGIGAALTTVGIGGTTGFLAGAGGAAVITTGGVVTGGTIATKGMARRTQSVRIFEIKPLHNQKRVSCFITMPGFMSSKDDDVRLPFSVLDPVIGDVFSVLWEPEMMAEMGNALKIITSEVLSTLGQTVLQATVMTALMSALQWPLILTKLGYLIDNPWSNALDRAKAAGLVLADTLINRHVGVRPVSLIGFSLGARAIFFALLELSKAKAFGIVQDVYLFGSTVTASHKSWLDVRSVVAGKLVNGYARNDWVLGYLFRATAGGNTIAGLRPIENVPGVTNLDITNQIAGHMSYRPMMPLLLSAAGLPVTADYFDEPEEPEFMEDRIIITAEEEAARREAKNRKWYQRKKKQTTPTQSNNSSRRASTNGPRSSNGSVAENDDDDLPPREDISREPTPQPPTPPSNDSTTELPSPDGPVPSLNIAPKAGFDFAAISKALGKDLDLRTRPATSNSSPEKNLSRQIPPLERSESSPLSPPTQHSETHRPSPLSSGSTSSLPISMPLDNKDNHLFPISPLPDHGSPTEGASHISSEGSSSLWGRSASPTPTPAIPRELEPSARQYTNPTTTLNLGATDREIWAPPARAFPPELMASLALDAPPVKTAPVPISFPPPAEESLSFGTSNGDISFAGDDPWSSKQGSKSTSKTALENPWN